MQSVTIKFKQHKGLKQHHINKITGLVEIKYLLPLISRKILDSNPRKSKINAKTTNKIIDSLKQDYKNLKDELEENLYNNQAQQLYCFKSKGILLGTTNISTISDKEYKLIFDDPSQEGILDGGHNMLSIALFVLKQYEFRTNSIKTWDDLVDFWEENRTEIKDKIENHSDSEIILSISVPIEIMCPTDNQHKESFKNSLATICTARNNNMVLPETDLGNYQGLYEDLKKALDDELRERIAWKSNDKLYLDSKAEEVKVTDVIALIAIPFSCPDFKKSTGIKTPFDLKQIYKETKKLDTKYREVIIQIADKIDDKYHINNKLILSAFPIVSDLTKIFDYIQTKFPEYYDTEDYETIQHVSDYIHNTRRKKQHLTQFFKEELPYPVLRVYIIPIIASLVELITVSGTGKDQELTWLMPPDEFLEKYLEEMIRIFKKEFEPMQNYPLNQIGKTASLYGVVRASVISCLVEEGIKH